VTTETVSPGSSGDQDIEQYLALVAHEVLTPLVVAQGYTSLLSGLFEEGDDEAGELAVGAARNVDLAVLLLQRLRDTAARGDERLELDRDELDLAALVRQIVADLSTTVVAEHPLSFDTPDSDVRAHADDVRIRQVLFNLLVNAAKYSAKGAPIEVRLTADAATGWATVVVRNHGFGVAPDDAERLFAKGERGDDGGPSGLGVGLYISRAIAEAHGGTLHVEPADVQGSRFILRLPTA
jgi:signal transduction histidine kinase